MEASDNWSGAFNFSPKVVVPFLAGLIAWAVTGLTAGFFDTTNLVVLIATLGYSVLGVAAPPAANVNQADVVALSAKRQR